MTWVKLDDGFPQHPKVSRVSMEARWLHIVGLCHCSRYLTNGLILLTDLPVMAVGLKHPKEAVAGLVGVGLWNEVDAGYQIHDYLEFQPSAAEVAERRTSREEAGRRGGLRSGEARRAKQTRSKPEALALKQNEANTQAFASKQNEANANPVPSRSVSTSSTTPSPLIEALGRVVENRLSLVDNPAVRLVELWEGHAGRAVTHEELTAASGLVEECPRQGPLAMIDRILSHQEWCREHGRRVPSTLMGYRDALKRQEAHLADQGVTKPRVLA